MFKCTRCDKQTEAGEKQNTVNIVRQKEYTHYKLVFDKKTRRKKKEFYNTTGYEPHKELHYCKECYEKTNQGEFVNGEDTQGKGRADQAAERGSTKVKRRSKVNGVNARRVV